MQTIRYARVRIQHDPDSYTGRGTCYGSNLPAYASWVNQRTTRGATGATK